MIFPVLSVSLIGLLGFILYMVLNGSHSWKRNIMNFLFAAWGGFVIGAIIGVLVDVIFAKGIYVAVLGHGFALLGVILRLLKIMKNL